MKTETHFALLVLVTLRSPDFDALLGDTEVSLKVWPLAKGAVGHQKALSTSSLSSPDASCLSEHHTIPSETPQVKDPSECEACPPCRVIQSGIHWPRWSVPQYPCRVEPSIYAVLTSLYGLLRATRRTLCRFRRGFRNVSVGLGPFPL